MSNSLALFGQSSKSSYGREKSIDILWLKYQTEIVQQIKQQDFSLSMDTLPPEIKVQFFTFLEIKDIFSCKLLSQEWRELAEESRVYDVILKKTFNPFVGTNLRKKQLVQEIVSLRKFHSSLEFYFAGRMYENFEVFCDGVKEHIARENTNSAFETGRVPSAVGRLEYSEELIGVMCKNKPRYSRSFELLCFCSTPKDALATLAISAIIKHRTATFRNVMAVHSEILDQYEECAYFAPPRGDTIRNFVLRSNYGPMIKIICK